MSIIVVFFKDSGHSEFGCVCNIICKINLLVIALEPSLFKDIFKTVGIMTLTEGILVRVMFYDIRSFPVSKRQVMSFIKIRNHYVIYTCVSVYVCTHCILIFQIFTSLQIQTMQN